MKMIDEQLDEAEACAREAYAEIARLERENDRLRRQVDALHELGTSADEWTEREYFDHVAVSFAALVLGLFGGFVIAWLQLKGAP